MLRYVTTRAKWRAQRRQIVDSDITSLFPAIPTTGSAQRLISKQSNIEVARKIYNHMLCFTQPNQIVVNALIEVAQKHKTMKDVVFLVDDMEKYNLTDNFAISSILSHVVIVEKNLEKSKKLWTMLASQSRPIKMNNFLCNKLIQLFCTHNEVDNAIAVLVYMKQHKIVTNSYTYKDILSWCKQHKNVTIARNLYNIGKSDILSEIILCNQIMSVFCTCGQTREALTVYNDMKLTRTQADNITYTILISSCIESNMVDAAQRLCEESDSVSLTTPLATTIIKVYCRIGKFDDAIKLYAKMNFSHSTTVPALVIINELTNASRYDEARTIVESLDPDVVRTSLELTSTIIKLYCRCNRIDLAMKLFHKLTPDAHVYNILISALVNAGKLDDAQQLVDSMHNHKFPPSVELTTTLIKLACKKKNFEQAVALFNKVSPTAHTYNVLISALIDDQEFSMAREISDTVPKKIVQSSAALLTTLIKLECKTNNMKQAQKLFKSLTNPTEVTYTVLLSGFIEAEMYEEADKLVAMINRHYSLQLQVTLIALYLKTKRYERAAEIYDTVHKSKLFEDPTTCAILLSLFSETSQQKYAEEIINAVGKQIVPNARLISSLIHYECKRKNLDKAMQLFLDMRSQKFEPSAITYVLMISTFVDAQRFSDVEKIANFMQQDNIKPSVELMNTMIKYKVKIKNLNKALEIFHTMCERTKPSIVTYNILLSGCIENNQYSKAQELYHQIQSQDLNVELYTTLIKLECRMNNVTKALELLQSMKDKGMNPDAATYTVLINNLPIQYDSIIDGLVDQAIKIEPSSELCSTIIKMYFSRNMEREGFTFFKKYVWNSNVASIDIIMQLFSCVDANQFVYDLKQEIYRKAHRNKFDNCVLMLCAAREYDISLVESMFQATTHKDIDFYNCLLYAYKSTGKGEKAVQILETMKDSVEPNSSSYLMVLTACSHSKLVTQARSIYDQLVNEHRVTDVHTNCMIDTYARAGNFVEAEKLVPHGKDNTIAWSSILGGCKIYSNVKLAEKATKLLEHDSSSYVMMGNIYGSQGMWQEQHQIRSLMDERKLSKIPGKSTIQIGEKFVSYVVEDNTATKEEIAYLKQLREAITLIGYEPDVSCVLKELPSHEAKVEHLWQHSEKLALAAGLLHTSDKINITKNLRMCLDCHEATKMISRVTQREIVIWDASRAHQFINGKCDCGDIY